MKRNLKLFCSTKITQIQAKITLQDSRFKILLTRLRHSVQHEHTVIMT